MLAMGSFDSVVEEAGGTYVSALGISRVFRATVGDGDDVGGLKGAAHLVVVPVGVLRAVVLVDGAEPVAKDVVVLVSRHLEEGGALGVDDGVGHVKVQEGLAAGLAGAVGGRGAVDEVQCRAGAGRDVRRRRLVKEVEVLLAVDVAEGLVDSEPVGAVGADGLGDLVEVGDAVRSDNLSADLQVGR